MILADHGCTVIVPVQFTKRKAKPLSANVHDQLGRNHFNTKFMEWTLPSLIWNTSIVKNRSA